MKFTIEEIIESVKDELLCYEEAEKIAVCWEKEFRRWVEKNKGQKKDVTEEKGILYFKLKDEEEVFEMADSYIDAVGEDKVQTYWEKF